MTSKTSLGKTQSSYVNTYSIGNKTCKFSDQVLEEKIAFIEPLINAMRVQGVDVFKAERYLHRAREAFLVGELASVNDSLERAHGNAEESKEIWINDIYNDIPRVESIISQASDFADFDLGALAAAHL